MAFHKILRELCDISIVVISLMSTISSIADFLVGADADQSFVKYMVSIISLIIVRQNAEENIERCRRRRKDER